MDTKSILDNYLRRQTCRLLERDFLMLALLYDNPSCASDLADKLLEYHSNISRGIRELMGRNLITVVIDEADRRRVVLSITDEGKKLLDDYDKSS